MLAQIKNAMLRRKLKKLKKQIDSGAMSPEEARVEINNLFTTGKISIYDARLVDGILFRKDLRDVIT